MEEYYRLIVEKYHLGDKEVDSLSPLVLAYIGDSVYDLYVRSYLIAHGGRKVGSLHRNSIGYVKAGSQCGTLDRISGILTGEEKQIVKRGRNANPSTVPKNADVTEYRYATGFEALLGYLFLKKKIGRLMEILDKCMPPEENGKTGLDETGETGVDENEKAGLDEPGTTGLGKNGIIVSDESGTVGFGKNK